LRLSNFQQKKIQKESGHHGVFSKLLRMQYMHEVDSWYKLTKKKGRRMLEDHILLQSKKVFGAQPNLELKAPCKIGDGILQLSENEIDELRLKFQTTDVTCSFFIPASGSGSRMFQFLHEFLEQPNEQNRGLVERFLNHITDFAFFKQLPFEQQQKLLSNDYDLDEFINFLLDVEGLQFQNLPKALVPFHVNGPFVLNPLQEHLVQGSLLKNGKVRFHFTIQPGLEEMIHTCIRHLTGITGNKFQFSFSSQDSTTDAIAFDINQQPLTVDGKLLTRPAGHGALLQNLQAIEEDIVFIKNIDNVQHYNKVDLGVETFQSLGGLLLNFKEEVLRFKNSREIAHFLRIVARFELLQAHEAQKLTIDQALAFLDRPSRVCGMVRNEGQPGGGPFWVNSNGLIQKQIVEKAQIANTTDQFKILVQSTHFNPVMIVLDFKQADTTRYVLEKFKDDETYFVVNKNYKGKEVSFSELPGLWNGSMAKWNTIFVEIPTETFSPVKTVLDLLNEAHQG
jgi:Domain of unknown function (DUF4301)